MGSPWDIAGLDLIRDIMVFSRIRDFDVKFYHFDSNIASVSTTDVINFQNVCFDMRRYKTSTARHKTGYI